MGQYYKPINLDDERWLYSHDYDSGLKLMEHSWIGNEFVGTVMSLMIKGGDWFRKRIVWAGDYYGPDDVPADGPEEIDYYRQCDEDLSFIKIKPTECMNKMMQRSVKLVNHTKKLYVRYDEMIEFDGWIVNPLPLLTACGNGRGGGDYREQYPDYDKVGIWAGDVLSIELAVPKGQWYKKFVVAFKE